MGAGARSRRLGAGTRLAPSPRVPSFSHELLVELFRCRAELAGELLEAALGVRVPEGRAAIGSSDLSQVTSPAYTADCVVRLGEPDALGAIVVEVQLAPDPDKRRSWPVYVAALAASLGCPVWLLVVTPSERVARWARAPIELGHPGFRLTPLVVGPSAVPRITEAGARPAPELAVLSVLAHPEEAVARAALTSIGSLAEDRARLYFDVILAALPEKVRAALEAWMQEHDYQSEFARRYLQQGIEEGIEQGIERGIERGLQRAVLALARAKVRALSADEEAHVQRLDDTAVLEQLLLDLGAAADEPAARAVLARLGAS
jgi:hypothetical protein